MITFKKMPLISLTNFYTGMILCILDHFQTIVEIDVKLQFLGQFQCSLAYQLYGLIPQEEIFQLIH